MTFGSVFGRTFSPTFQPSSQAAVVSAIILYDTFTDTDGTALTSHTPDIVPSGKAWENIASAGKIYNNRAQQDADGGCVIDCGYSDCVITANLLSSYEAASTYSRQCGIIFRHNGTNYWQVKANAASNVFAIYNPAVSAVASVNVDIGAGELLTIVVTLNGNSITATLNGGNEISTSSSTNVDATKHGYWLFRRTSSPYTYCDDFKIETL